MICENNMATISCVDTPGTKLNIMYANYGRTSTDICVHPFESTGNTGCKASDETLETVQEDCQDMVSCELDANNENFGETCFGTYKYLEVQFECQISGRYQILRHKYQIFCISRHLLFLITRKEEFIYITRAAGTPCFGMFTQVCIRFCIHTLHIKGH